MYIKVGKSFDNINLIPKNKKQTVEKEQEILFMEQVETLRVEIPTNLLRVHKKNSAEGQVTT